MSYAIGHIIYGIPFTSKISKTFNEYIKANPDKEGLELDDIGFEFVYSGSADYTPGWCGVQLDRITELNDCCISNLKLNPSEKESKEAIDKVAALPQCIKDVSFLIDTYIVWGTS